MSEWYQRCVACGADVPNGKMAEHLRACAAAQREPHTPFSGRASEPVAFAQTEVPKE